MGLGSLLLIPGLGDTATALDIRASVGTSTSPTSTGTKAVTGVGFQPKVVMPFSPAFPVGTSTGASTAFGFGCGINSSSRASIGVNSRNAVTTSSTYRQHTNSKIFTMPNDATASTIFEADLSAIGPDGFTLNWSIVLATERILNHICLGGADLEVSLTQHQMNATNAPQSFAHGLSGAPTGVMFFTVFSPTAPPATSTFLTPSIGLFAGANQFCATLHSSHGLTTTFTRRILTSTSVINDVTGAGIVARSMAVSSVDGTNVNCTYPVTSGTGQAYFWMLAIRGAKCQTGTFDCNGSTSPLTINTPGITPKLFLPVFVPTGVDSINTVLNELFLTIGASDGVNNVSCGITDANAQTTTNARRSQSSTSLSEYATDGTIRSVMTAGFSGESVVLTPTTMVNNAFGQGAYLVVGA